MGPEIIAAIVGPILGGTVSLLLFLNKQNSETISTEFKQLNTSVMAIEDKVDTLSLKVAENYVTNDVLTAHIQGEERWHLMFNQELNDMREDIGDTKRSIDRISRDDA